MRSPKDMDVVQIEVTNACERACSNCTRFCGHHRGSFFMETGFFKKAVDSMRGFTHCLGVMGGEPTLHPRFAELCEYIRDNFPQSRPHHVFAGPGREFVAEVDEKNLRLKKDTIRGLFSSLGPHYYRHFETIQDTFGFQCLNDHVNPSTHGALMVGRKELGIPDDEWIRLRDNCWVQNLWSASITPKGAFFCEIAASMDMLLDGPGGWKVEPGWWERGPEDFGDQLHWCELCGAALALPKTDAREETDDVSPEWRRRLEALGSRKAKRGGIKDFDIARYNDADYEITRHHRPYLADKKLRMSLDSRALFPQNIVETDSFGKAAEAIRSRDGGAWIFLSPGEEADGRILPALRENVFNPGCLYFHDEAGRAFFNTAAAAFRDAVPASRDGLAACFPPGKRVRIDFEALQAEKGEKPKPS